MIWKMNVKTVTNGDTGDKKLRITHTLTAPILETDVIQFTFGFRPDSFTYSKNTSLIAYDAASCKLTIKASDKRFWEQSSADGYFKCNGNLT